MATEQKNSAVNSAVKAFLFLIFIISFQTNDIFSQSSWQWLQPVPTGNTFNSVEFLNKNTGFAAGVLGAIIKTTDGGNNWNSKNSGTQKDLYTICFKDKATCFTAGKSGILISTTDAGNSWKSIKTGNYNNIYDIKFPSESTGYLAGLSGTILKTTDNGLSWNQQSTGTSNSLFCMNFLNENIGVAGGYNTILKTTNGGLNWINQNVNIFPVCQINGITIIDSSNIIAVSNSSTGNIYKTTNGGLNWNKYSMNLHYLFDGAVDLVKSSDFKNLNTGFAVTDFGTILKTTNSGINWMSDSSFRPSKEKSGIFTDVVYADSNNIHIIGGGGTNIKCNNDGVTWNVNIGNKKDIRANYFTDAKNGYCVGEIGIIMKTPDLGLTWIYQDSETENQLNTVYFADKNTGFTAGDNGVIMKTTDAGNVWSVQNSNTNINDNINSIYFFDENTGIAVGGNDNDESALILRTTDGGDNWQTIDIINSAGSLTSVCFINSFTGFISGKNGMIYKTGNSGNSWSYNNISTYNLNSISFKDSLTGITVGENGVIYKTTNAGSNWNFLTSGNYKTLFNVKYKIDNSLIATGENGVILTSLNGGNNWNINNTTTDNAIYSLHISDNSETYLFGKFGSVLKSNLQKNLLAAKIKNNEANDFKLSQNYPNPFNPGTKINFTIPQDARREKQDVKIVIYNALGKEVQVLINEKQNPGNYTVNFNGAEYPSGVYFYKLQVSDINGKEFSETKRMLLIK